ncbi:TIGR03085 family protein [Calidifontibacter sp. DB0510]|uniref:TIGR03085 family protein n=1 Tax=Metallococcus carri TaxID=1656884 RepID=A0A967B5G4_9MICO|nr:TIGR03085 family metal-binding protein [Metallococcus carri]NHN54986.1 TIGR03085 family protein [Metallococcus carri]NOP37332.1 TIGR03085 family protein [Calidifontibacter sp. DB2511S]
MARFARAERDALCDTFTAVGPDAPTLCKGWQTRDLAAHLILRERRPDAALGMFLAPLAGRLDKIQSSFAQRPFAELVETVRQGPPRWSPFALSPVDEAGNLVEFFIHHEDVLRAQEGRPRRELSEDEQKSLYAALPRIAPLALRSVRTGVVADCGDFGRQQLRGPKDDHGNVVIIGAPSEVLLEIYGRGAHADTELDGADHDVAAYRETARGL